MWQPFIANIAVVGLFGFAWLHSQDLLRHIRRPYRTAIFGTAMGIGAIISMLLTSEPRPGVFIDLRACFVAVAAFLGGPVAVAIAAIVAGSFRIGMGGSGLVGGLVSIVFVAAIGLAARVYFGPRRDRTGAIAVFAAATSLAPLVGFAILPEAVRDTSALGGVLLMVVTGFVSTFLATCFLLQGQRRMEEQKLLQAAYGQAPDHLFVKDRQSRFVMVNNQVAADHGFASPTELRGRTDFDIVPPPRAQKLFDAEQEILRTGGAQLNSEELVDDASGQRRWLLTSKVAVRNLDGEVIGLAGAARDITERKRLEEALVAGRDQLDLVLGAMSDGLARFDADGVLQFSNDRYRALFPLTGDVRVPGARLVDILKAAADRREQMHIPEQSQAWVDAVLATLETGGEEEAPLLDGRWLHIRTRPMSDGGATVVVSDITSLKRAEGRLMALTDQLRQMATTDALTGLLNRRGFDERLEDEAIRAHRSGQPLSLGMVDIDRFKAYNDHYGHQAGDECLKQVAAALKAGVRRPADVAARYGGEEMTLILPETDLQAARQVAERLRISVRELGLTHAGSEKRCVTVSVGVATLAPGPLPMSGAELVRRADQALYNAKDAGRDRVMGWGERHVARA